MGRRAAALLVLAIAAAGAPRAQGPAPRVIEVTAERFDFWPPEITAVEGEAIVIRLRSDDTLHGFRIVGTGTNVLIPKRGKGVVDAKLSGLKAGRYTFECSRLCGAGHNFMRGVLVVRAGAGTSP
jgi:cytochrome c oxidase subunit 2